MKPTEAGIPLSSENCCSTVINSLENLVWGFQKFPINSHGYIQLLFDRLVNLGINVLKEGSQFAKIKLVGVPIRVVPSKYLHN